jgi:hypothetical protein
MNGPCKRLTASVAEVVRRQQEIGIDVPGAVGRDPVQVRTENMMRPEQMPYASIGRMHYDSGDYPANVRLCAELLGVPAIRQRQRQESQTVGRLALALLRSRAVRRRCRRIRGPRRRHHPRL